MNKQAEPSSPPAPAGGAREFYAAKHNSVWKVYQWWNHPEVFEFAEAYADQKVREDREATGGAMINAFAQLRQERERTPITTETDDYIKLLQDEIEENGKLFAELNKIILSEREARERVEKERDALEKENKRLILQYTVAHSYWYDGDAHFDSPEEYADENNLKVGEEFELDASTYWEEKFRVTKVPDENNDDYECETISKQREEFETYQQMAEARERAERALRTMTESRDKFGQAALDNRLEIDRLEEVLRSIAALPLGHHDAKKLALASLKSSQEEGKL